MFRYLLLFLLLSSCGTQQMMVNYPSGTTPLYSLEPAPQKILLLNHFNISAQKYRDNKEELFREMIDSLLQESAQRIQSTTGIPAVALKGVTYSASADTVLQLLQQHGATHAIAVSDFVIEFVQTRVDVTKESNGSKSREAFYDIRAALGYNLYSTKGRLRTDDVVRQQFHSSRNVASGLLAAGPNVVVQRRDAYRILFENVHEYLNRFFPGQKTLYRPVFTGKGFEATAAALKRGDYEAALIESMKLIKATDAKTAAMAHYNCAVFFERKNQPAEAKKYLEASLQLAPLAQARNMMMDY
ncbi:MAG: hypothetical protein KGZ74_09455 [Chitinophagaceae bacterium]|nr:hypothetical protein [Chitinophagaceae bacterium]